MVILALYILPQCLQTQWLPRILPSFSIRVSQYLCGEIQKVRLLRVFRQLSRMYNLPSLSRIFGQSFTLSWRRSEGSTSRACSSCARILTWGLVVVTDLWSEQWMRASVHRTGRRAARVGTLI